MNDRRHATGATLLLADPARKEQMSYAARVLLDSAGFDLPLRLAEASPGSPPGLSLPGDVLVAEDELNRVFDSITLRREIDTGRQDNMGMFDEAAVAWDVSRPWIDLRAAELAGRMSSNDSLRSRGRERFRVIISHDIDRTDLREPILLMKTLVRVFDFCSRWFPIASVISPKRWLKSFERLLECERSHGVGAYYFFMSGPYGLGRYSSRSDIRWAQSRKILNLITQAGMTVGLHGSYHAREQGSYGAEKERIEQSLGGRITCHRNHYLRFDPRRVWSQLEAAGIRYDFSIGFNYRMGFRAGCGKAYRTFDLESGRSSTVVAIPLLLMDGVMLYGDREELLRQLRTALEEVKRVDGCVSLLFHPEMFLIDPQLFTVFENILEMCEGLDADLSGKLPEVPGAAE